MFFNLTGANTNDALEAVEREASPLSPDRNRRDLSERWVPRRVDALFAEKDGLGLTDQQQHVPLSGTHIAFTRAGAGRPAEAEARPAAV